jgi:hypothetical protein
LIIDHLFDEHEVRYLTDAQFRAWNGCVKASMKQQCPEFTGFGPSRPPPDDPAE